MTCQRNIPPFVHRDVATTGAHRSSHTIAGEGKTMRVTMKHLLLIAAATAAACQDDQKGIVAPGSGDARTTDANGPIVHITSPLNDDAIAGGIGRLNEGSLTGGSGFTIVIETVTRDAADVSANE